MLRTEFIITNDSSAGVAENNAAKSFWYYWCHDPNFESDYWRKQPVFERSVERYKQMKLANWGKGITDVTQR